MMAEGIFHLVPGESKPDYERFLHKGIKAELLQQIMTRQPEVYPGDADLRKLIGKRLGWVDVATAMKKQVASIEKFGEKCFEDGIRHVVLMGMGGSSLAPEVFKSFFGKHEKLDTFDVLDSTDPSAITAVGRNIALERTLFIVASKSGGTIETRSHEAYFIGRLRHERIRNFGRHFAAITDSGSSLEAFAKTNKYRKVFVNPSDIGGRYSALSFFGLVPAYFAGVDLRALLDDAIMMEELLRERKDESNPGLALGALISAAWKAGRDKLTFIASKKAAPFVPWIEQLIAESTGKKGKGIVPIEGEPVEEIGHYGTDRVFVFLRMAKEKAGDHVILQRELMMLRTPIVEMTLGSTIELGRQFLLWEAAVAAAGWYLGINPFDEPNVTESKENTKKILDQFGRIKRFPVRRSAASSQDLTLLAMDRVRGSAAETNGHLPNALREFLAEAEPPKYLSILSYFKADRRTESIIAEIRKVIGGHTKCATLRGYGPRFLHSIGQLYKGGAPEGMFIVFIRADYGSLGIPGQPFDFGQLITAQAIGDSQALIKRKLPTLLIEIEGSPAGGLEHFFQLVRTVVEK